jgi:hypothetical protein
MTTLAGILLPSTVLDAGWFQALAAFVAVNTLIHAALASPNLPGDALSHIGAELRAEASPRPGEVHPRVHDAPRPTPERSR